MDRGSGTAERKKLSGRKALGIVSLASGIVLLVCVVGYLSFPDAFVRRFLEERITKGFAASYPDYSIRISGLHFDLMKNRIACDTVAVSRNDSTFFCSAASLSVSGIRWLEVLRGQSALLQSLGGSALEAGEVDMAFQPSGYGLKCGPLRMSVPDSEIAAEALEIHPLVDDEQFLGESRFRKTRFGMSARQCRLGGLACVDLLQGKNIHVRSVVFRDVALDVLINKDKPSAVDSRSPRMPNEIMSSMKDTVGLDSLIISGGRMLYCERFVIGRKPATLTFDDMQVLVTGIASHAGPAAGATVQARAIFMGSGTVNLAMSIPLSVREFSFRYSGSLGGMDLSRLNPWLEPSDQSRIKSGMLGSASFAVDVRTGSATGSVNAVYRDLVVASISRRTGSESGLMERFTSWVAKNVTIRRTNTPDRSGAMKIGTVKYARKKNEPFFGFAWFALRTGVGDVVGF